MRYTLSFLIGLLCLCCSCTQHDESSVSADAHRTLRFLFQSETQTRASDDHVQDVNLYLYHEDGVVAQHLYSDTQDVAVELLPGRYTLYTLANAGRDMGERSRSEAEALTCEYDPQTLGDGLLPMAARQQIEVTYDATVSVTLVRAVAKVSFSYTIDKEFAPHVTVLSVQLRNAARTIRLFDVSRAVLPTDVADCAPIGELEEETFSTVFYLLENCQGTVPGITSQGQKDPDHAPALATYVQIEAVADGVQVIYRIYLGEDNTSNFDIERNRIYHVHVHIKGVNALDTRVSTTELTVAPFRISYEQGQTAYSELRLQCTNGHADGNYTLRYNRELGASRLRVNGKLLDPGEAFALHPDKGEVTIPVQYEQDAVGDVRLRLSLTSDEGTPIERLLTTTYVKPVPRIAAALDKTALRASDRAVATITLTQTGYTGSYKVRIDGTPTLFISTASDVNPATSFTLPGVGVYRLRLRAEAVGTNTFTVQVTDAEGQTATAQASVQGLKTVATYSLRFDASLPGELSVMAEGTYPVQENLYLTVRPTVQINTGGKITYKSFTMPLYIQKDRDVATYTLDLGLTNGQTYSLSSYTALFSRSVSENGMVEYRVK